jgi:8-oxo-dGTP pyrophosphatase MutT (NUDIX family)
MSAPTMVAAATILLVRDAPGLEVLMVERHHQIDFASGALVFPGGKASAGDSDPRWLDHCDGHDSDPVQCALKICAVREAFEESGVLLARPMHARGAGAPFATPAQILDIGLLRAAIDKGEASFLDALIEHGLVLALDALTPFAHWITPEGMPKRFDTWFYIAETPPEQAAACDGREAVDAVWIPPEDALKAAREGRRTIIFPTRLNIEKLAESSGAHAAIEAARTRPVVTVLPKVIKENGEMILTIPAEAGYSVTREPLEGNRP